MQHRSKAMNFKDLYNLVITRGQIGPTVTADAVLNCRDTSGRSILSAITEKGRLDICKVILEKCPSLLYIQDDTSKYTVLHQAIHHNHYRLINYFLSVGLEAATNEGNMERREENMRRFKKWIKLKNYNKDTVLTQATLNGNLRIIKELIKVDREYKLGLLETVGRNRKTALQWAVKDNKPEMIELLTHEGDPSIATTQAQGALHTRNKSDSAVATTQAQEALHEAIYDMDLFNRVNEGDLDYIKTVAADVLLHARDRYGRSVLSIAIRYGNFDCCKEILKKCRKLLYFQDDSYFKSTVLHYAEAFDNYMILDYFLSVGLEAPINEGKLKNMLRFKTWIKLKNHEQDTALTQATYNRNLHIAKRLIEVDREYKLGLSETIGRDSQTALQLAVEYHDHDIIKMLSDEGDPYSDYIPYSIAMDLFDHVKNGDLDYVKAVRSDVLLKSRDNNRDSALSIATEFNQLGCCEVILKRCPILLYHQNSNKDTVLHHTSYYGNGIYRLVDLFIGVGLDAATVEGDFESKAENMQRFKNWISTQDNSGQTALHSAVSNCYHYNVKRLLQVDRQYKLGLSEITSSYGATPLQLAMESEDQEMIKLFTEGTDPDMEHGANTDDNMSLLSATTQAEEALHTGNNSDSAGKDATNAYEKVHHTSLATDRMEDFYVEEFDKNSSIDLITRLLSDLASEKPQPYSRAQLIKFTKEFSDPVGSGEFGDVYKGEFPNGEPIAVKVLKNSQPKLMEKQFAAEVSTMGRIYHRNLIKLYGYCYEADMKALIYEYMEKGALDVILEKNNLDMVKLYTIATEIARGISYLHESCKPQIIHHDLKTANVLLDSEFSPRVIDFGLTSFNLEKNRLTHFGRRGSHGYIAPEIVLQGLGKISSKCDVYSFGMMLFDILKSQIYYGGQGWLPGQVWEKFKENKLGNFLREHGIKEDDEAKAKTLSMIALSCSEHYPQKRPSMSSVVRMFEGDMTPCPSANPFPLYFSSYDSDTIYE